MSQPTEKLTPVQLDSNNEIQSPVLLPTIEETTTMRHALSLINQREVMSLVQFFKIKLPSDISKVGELKIYLGKLFSEGQLEREVFNECRKMAFNPELHSTDGFFLSYICNIDNQTEESLTNKISLWNKHILENLEKSDSLNAQMIMLEYKNKKVSVCAKRKHERFIHNNESMYSQKYYEIHDLVVDIYFDKKIIYFQTSNTGKYSSIKRVICDFLEFLIDEKVKLLTPKLNQQLSLSIIEKEGVELATRHEYIHPSTIKLLDLILELENNPSNNFSDFECADITFDHEDSTKEDILDKIRTQAFGSELGDLFKKEEILGLIKANRKIFRIEFKIMYSAEDGNGNTRIHTILAGIDNAKNKYLRIYMYNNDLSIKEVLLEAYIDLKELFIKHITDNTLRNEEKIKLMLGL